MSNVLKDEAGNGYIPIPDWRAEAIRLSNLVAAALAEPLWEDMERVLRGDLVRERELCPEGCGCRKGTDDADAHECACDGPCCMDPEWGPSDG